MKRKLKPFLMKETLVNLSRELEPQVQARQLQAAGGDDLCGTITDWRLQPKNVSLAPSCIAC